MREYIVGLGSNEGDSLSILQLAVGLLGDVAQLKAVSPLYESSPIGGPRQKNFLNAAVRLETDSPAETLLVQLLELERQAGRTRATESDAKRAGTLTWGPRTLDLDILWAGQQRNENPACEVPHPRLTQRRFALQPLLDLVPDAIDPLTGCRYVESLPAVADQQISLVSRNWADKNVPG